jgi:hypothetical protein
MLRGGGAASGNSRRDLTLVDVVAREPLRGLKGVFGQVKIGAGLAGTSGVGACHRAAGWSGFAWMTSVLSLMVMLRS